VRFRPANDKWRSAFTSEQQTILQAVLQGHLERNGYDSSD
jgi:hypothetical protein